MRHYLVVGVVVAVVGALGVEGEGVYEGLAAPLGAAAQLAGAQHALRPHHHQEKKLKQEAVRQCQCRYIYYLFYTSTST